MNANMKKDPKQSEPLFDRDDLHALLSLTSDRETDTRVDPDQLEDLLVHAGRAINEAHPMPPIKAPREDLSAHHEEAANETGLIPFPQRRTLSNGVVGLALALGMAASFGLAAFLFGVGSPGQVDPIAAIEEMEKTRTAPPHPEALVQYNQKAADALLERAEHLLVLWQFHEVDWYLEETLRNLLEAKSYQANDARILEALAKVYKHLNQKEKELEYRKQAEKLRQE